MRHGDSTLPMNLVRIARETGIVLTAMVEERLARSGAVKSQPLAPKR
jgi:hypothetical protein